MDLSLTEHVEDRREPRPRQDSGSDPRVPLRLLVVEDDAQDRALLMTLTRPRAGEWQRSNLTFAGTLAEAQQLLTTQTFDVALVDLALPDSFGLETLERLLSSNRDVPILVLTGDDSTELAERALARGAQDYLPKGRLDRATLDRALRYAIQRQRVVTELETVSSQLRTANSRLAKIALIDPLTSLLNRRGLQQALTRELHWSERDATTLSALLVDIDDFRDLNAGFGHAVGDVVLQEVARQLREGVRPEDYVGRIGGDQFLVLFTPESEAEGRSIAEQLRFAMQGSHITSGGKSVQVTASIALIQIPEELSSIDSLLGYCNRILGSAKAGGKNRIAENAESAATQSGSAVSAALESMRTGRGLRVARQPIVRLSDGGIVGFEFLARSEVEPFHMPGAFFGLAQENELLTLIDQRFFELSADASTQLDAGSWAHLNVFPSTLIDVPTISLVETLVSRGHATRTCVEISEQQIIGDPDYLQGPVSELRNAGVRIGIDDVGFGRSSLESLVQLEPDVIKIDRRCVLGLVGSSDKQRSLVRLLAVASTLGAEVVAEGIESREDLFALQDLGVRYGQGYLWGRPM